VQLCHETFEHRLIRCLDVRKASTELGARWIEECHGKVRARVEAHLARMLAFDFEAGVKEWRRAWPAQGWYWTREQQAELLGELPGPFEPIERDLGPAVAAVWALYESTFKNACVMD